MKIRCLLITLLASIATASDLTPITFESGKWLGNDGNWSTVAIEVGSPSQNVNVLVSTALSELWVVGSGGCLQNEPVCDAARGGVFTPSKSNSWQSLNVWQLGLAYLGYGGNGDYGREMASGQNPLTRTSFTMHDVAVAAINVTEYYQGLFGLGIAKGSFGDEAIDTPLTKVGISAARSIPSVSYGYTAGAHYKNMPSSLTLGGSDTARYVWHNNQFVLAQTTNMPIPLVRGIEYQTTAKDAGEQNGQTKKTEVLSDWDNAFLATIDSTTPYLWLPGSLCDRFAKALNLTYNETFDLYTISNEQYQAFASPESGSFTFSLSSLDDRDDLGTPLDIPGIVNITVSMQAFVGLLQYPFKNEAINYGDPAIPYFSLRRAHDNSTFIIGRAFLQEAYLVTKYDEAMFSIHPATFPKDPIADANVVAIIQGSNSPYAPDITSGSGSGSEYEQDHSTGPPVDLITGLAVGIPIGCAVLFAIAFFFYRRKKQPHVQTDDDLVKACETPSSSGSDSSRTTVGRLLSKIIKRKQISSARSDHSETQELRTMEAPNSQIHEMPVPTRPVELDGSNVDDDIVSDEIESSGTQQVDSYEAARQRIERQLQGPVPEYSPPADGMLPPTEKPLDYLDEPSSRPHINTAAGQSALEEPTIRVDSPYTPTSSNRATWTRRLTDIPAPIIVPNEAAGPSNDQFVPSPSPCLPSGETSLSHPYGQPAPSPLTPAPYSLQPPSPVRHREPINTSNIVCLGPLPDNIQSPERSSSSHAIPQGGNGLVATPSFRGHRSQPSVDTLGSDFTETEERMAVESGEWSDHSPVHSTPYGGLSRLMTLHRRSSTHSLEPDTPQSMERVTATSDLVHIPQIIHPEESASHSMGRVAASRDLVHVPEVPIINPDTPRGRVVASDDLVHVPQMASQRYSWEEER